MCEMRESLERDYSVSVGGSRWIDEDQEESQLLSADSLYMMCEVRHLHHALRPATIAAYKKLKGT